MKSLTLTGLIAAVMAFAAMGCTPQAREQYSEAGESAQMSAKKTGEAVATDAKVTGEVVKDAAQESEKAIENTGMTGQVRAAFTNAHDLDLHDLNVDTVGNTIILKGRAETAEDKQQAEALAKATAGNDYKVDNRLTVGGGD